MSRRLIVILVACLAVIAGVVWATLGHGPGGAPVGHPGGALPQPATSTRATRIAQLVAMSDRTHKVALIERLTAPPQVVIFGGSRALRFDPAYIERRTGLTGFNAAVTGARPEDAWAFLNLLHARFPGARFRFLWIIHADEFDQKPLDLGILENPALARYFPPSLIRAQTRWARAHIMFDIMQRGRVFAPDGHVLHDVLDIRFPQPGADAAGVSDNISRALLTYATTPRRLFPRSIAYFECTLALMESFAVAPRVVVTAPVDPRILAATVGHGWGVRHRLLLRFLASLRPRYKFFLADLSRAAACGCTARDFYDGIHLRPSGTRKIVDTVLRMFPRALLGHGAVQ